MRRDNREKLLEDRESGNRDYRMVPVAIAIWVACLVPGAGSGSGHLLVTAVVVALVAVAAVAAVVMAAAAGAAGYGRVSFLYRRCCSRFLLRVLVVGVGMLCAVSSSFVHAHADHQDAAFVENETAAPDIGLRVAGPPMASTQRGSDCQFRAFVTYLVRDGVLAPSHEELLVFASGTVCTVVESEEFAVTGVLRPATFGAVPIWCEIGEDSTVHRIRAPTLMHRVVARLRQSFLEVCQELSEQARVLVPGVTLGVLGSETVLQNAQEDAAAGKVIEDHFKNAGIVHLLAVSGGHFVLIADFLRRRMTRLRAPQLVVSVMVGIGYCVLAALMYPSDSVLRAVVMGFLGIACGVRLRRTQSMSVLSWTMIGCLIVQPSLARSFGFALSCAAVAGIVLFSAGLTRWLSKKMPRGVAEALSVTVCAQIFTLPVQLLMRPSVPLLSVVANLCVAPFVGFSTVCGLIGLLVSWAFPWLGRVCAFVAGMGTSVMNRCAAVFGGESAVWSLPLPGAVAAAVVLGVEITVAVMAVVIRRRMKRVTEDERGTERMCGFLGLRRGMSNHE